MKNFVLGLIVVMIVLVGGAQAQTPPHQVVLDWTNSITTCVVNTNVHRTTTPGTAIIGNNFAIVPVATHGFTDNAVVAGTTYYYSLSAYGPTCGGTTHESVLTPELVVMVPVDCNPPSTIINGVCVAPPDAPKGLTLKSVQ